MKSTVLCNIVVLIYKQIFFMIILFSEEVVCQQTFVRNPIVILSCALLSPDTLKSSQL